MNKAKLNASPKIVINKKNFVFKEAIDLLNQERLTSRKYISDVGIDSLYSPLKEDNDYEDIKPSPRKQNLDPSYNPFGATSIQSEKSSLMNKILSFTKSKSVLGCTGNFLNRVEDTTENLPYRRSEVPKYNHEYSRQNTKSDSEPVLSDRLPLFKLSFDLASNKEESTNHENSMLSSEISVASSITPRLNI